MIILTTDLGAKLEQHPTCPFPISDGSSKLRGLVLDARGGCCECGQLELHHTLVADVPKWIYIAILARQRLEADGTLAKVLDRLIPRAHGPSIINTKLARQWRQWR
jgi:hypothetical protein